MLILICSYLLFIFGQLVFSWEFPQKVYLIQIYLKGFDFLNRPGVAGSILQIPS